MGEIKLKWYQVRLSFMGKFLFILFGLPALLYGFFKLILFIIVLIVPPSTYLYRDLPGMKMKPVELQNKTILTTKGIPASALGYAFTLPWNALEELPNSARLHLKGLYGSSDHEVMSLTVDESLDSFQDLNNALRAEAGEKDWTANPSKYDILANALNTTPDNVSMWVGQAKRERVQVALTTKMIAIFEARKIQKIQFGEMRGFEFSDQVNSKLHVYELILFDNQDKAIKLNYFPMKDEAESITQEKINAIVASLHAVAPQSTSGAESRR